MDYSGIFARLFGPLFYPWLSNQRIYWLYLSTALLIAIAAYLVVRRRAGGVQAPDGGLLRFLFPSAVFGHRSAWVDYKFFVINRAGFALLVAPVLIGTGPISDLVATGLKPLLGDGGAARLPHSIDHLFYTTCMVLAFDGALYLGHWLQHKVPALWEFHKVHHSAQVLTPMSAYRMHPVDDILTGVLVALASGTADGLFRCFYETTPTTVMLFNLNVFVFLFYLAGYNLRHSHIWVAYPRSLSHFLISPAQHQIHHSNDPAHYDKNFGFIFAFWDWAAGTLYVPKHRETLELGLANDEHLAFDTVWQLYARPFRVLWRRYHPLEKESP